MGRPENIDDIMEEMRTLAQQDLDRKKNRHRHFRESEGGGDDEGEYADDDGGGWEGEEGEEEEDWSDEGIDQGEKDEEGEREMRGGGGVDQRATVAGEDPEEQARAALEEIMAESASRSGRSLDREAPSSLASPSGGKIGGGNTAAASEFGTERSLTSEQDERGLEAMEEFHEGGEGEEETEEEEYGDWTPLMHEGLKERTVALMGVAKILEADAMAAARRADADSGFGGRSRQPST